MLNNILDCIVFFGVLLFITNISTIKLLKEIRDILKSK